MPTVPEASDKPCPFCGEVIKAEAKICRFCKSDLVANLPAVRAEGTPAPVSTANRALSQPNPPASSGASSSAQVFDDVDGYVRPLPPEDPVRERMTIAAFVGSFVVLFPSLWSLRLGFKYLDHGSGRIACLGFGIGAIALCVTAIVLSVQGARSRMRSLARAALMLASLQLVATFVMVVWVFFSGN